MLIHLGLAYAIFCTVPLGLAVSIAWRRRQVERKLRARQAMIAEARSTE
ncbi:MAG: hypothetical protein ACP5HG_00305 [Anaerolineae bacterium]